MAPIDAFNAIATEFAGDAAISTFIGFALEEVDPVLWGGKFDRGVAYLAAHLMAISKRGSIGPGGSIVEEKVGDNAMRYNMVRVREGEMPYSLTSYGIEFLRLRRTIIRGPIVLNGQ